MQVHSRASLALLHKPPDLVLTQLAELAAKTASDSLRCWELTMSQPLYQCMAAKDFAYYAQKATVCFSIVGTYHAPKCIDVSEPSMFAL